MPESTEYESETPPLDLLTGALCHYTSAQTAFDHILPSQSLRMSPYVRMRDPLENRELGFVSARPTGGDNDEGRLLQMADLIQQVRRGMLLLSFSTDASRGYRRNDEPFMRGWARARMWEQYAENHAGVCIVFKREPLLEAVRAGATDAGKVAAREVSYLPRGFADTDTHTVDLSRFNPFDLPGLARFVIEHQDDLFFVKALDWEGEHEFRIVELPPEARSEQYKVVPFGGPSSIAAVIVGERFPAWQLPGARAVCDRLDVRLLQLDWRAGIPHALDVR
jgi:hypothetical protein